MKILLNRGPWGPSGDNGDRWKPASNRSFDDLDEWLKKFKQRTSGHFQGGKSALFLLVLLLLGWLASGIYFIDEAEQAAVLRLGKWVRTVSQSGLHYRLPAPFEKEIKRKVYNINTLRLDRETLSHDSYMLTGDENFIELSKFEVHWFIKDLGQFLFSATYPEALLRAAAESALREIIARSTVDMALAEGRTVIGQQVQELLQTTLDKYEIGIEVKEALLKKVEPPAVVIDAFRDVQSAKIDKEKVINEAEAYAKGILPEARGLAVKILNQSKAERDAAIARAEGDAKRFLSIFYEYRQHPKETEKRLYLETMEKVLKHHKKFIIEDSTVMSYLPLPALKNLSTSSGKE